VETLAARAENVYEKRERERERGSLPDRSEMERDPVFIQGGVLISLLFSTFHTPKQESMA